MITQAAYTELVKQFKSLFKKRDFSAFDCIFTVDFSTQKLNYGSNGEFTFRYNHTITLKKGNQLANFITKDMDWWIMLSSDPFKAMLKTWLDDVKLIFEGKNPLLIRSVIWGYSYSQYVTEQKKESREINERIEYLKARGYTVAEKRNK